MSLKKENILFIHIPKSGGTSVNDILLNKLNGRKIKKRGTYHLFDNKGVVTFSHLNVNILREMNVINDDFYNNAFKFCFVRNPWDRFISEYFYKLKHNQIENKLKFEPFCYKMKEKGVVNIELHMDHFNKQSEWIIEDIDFIGRFESLQSSWGTICDITGIKYRSLPHRNKGKHKDYRKYYNSNTKKIIEELYRDDIERFKYTF